MSDDLVGSILDHNSLGQTFVNFCTADVLKCGSQCATVPSANFLSLTLRLPENFLQQFRPSVSTFSWSWKSVKRYPGLLAEERKIIVVEEFLVEGLPPQIPRTL